nr:reverse transcriptase domain-containing protein [Tanacetum cinerariifolium]
MSSRTAEENHHHQATRLDLYHLQLFRIQPLDVMPPKRTSTSAAPAMTQADIRQLVVDSVAAALEAQAVNMENINNINRNPKPREAPELVTLCPTMVPNFEKMMEVFIGGLPQSIKGNVTASKPQTLEEAINISQRLMDQ